MILVRSRASIAVVAPVALAAALGLARDAGANGRSPATNGVVFRPGDAQSVYIRATFGLLISHDDGCSFRWVCEQAVGYGGEFDPKYAVAQDGTLFATTFTGLRVSRDGGCSWRTATEEQPDGTPGRIAGLWIDALDVAANGDVWVATAVSGRSNDVYRSTDNGVTFAARNQESPTIWWKSVKVAPTDPARVYLTGYQVAPEMATHLLRSDDGGDAWTPAALEGVQLGLTPLVYAVRVDPADADIVYLVSLGANPPNGDRLYRSADGGATFTEVLATDGTIRDVVYHGASRVLVAAGTGGFESTDRGVTFAPLADAPQLACLGERGGELFGCGANWQPDFQAVTRSGDAATWTKQFRFVELAGALECPPGTTSQIECDPMWPALQAQFGATGPTGPACAVPPDAPPDPPKNGGGGCCDAGDGAPPVGLALLVLLAATRGRGARGRAASASPPPRPRSR